MSREKRKQRRKQGLPEYSEELFIDREKETEDILGILKDLIACERTENRFVVLRGEIGTGKTWFLRHLESRIKMKWPNNTVVLRADLNEIKEAGGRPIAFVMILLEHLWRALDGQVNYGQGIEDMSRYFTEFLRANVFPKKVLVLLLDHVLEQDWHLLDALEEYLLAPLLQEDSTFVVITGRKRLYAWKTPLLRMRSKFIALASFDRKAYTEEQLRKQVGKEAGQKAGDIHKKTGGNPLANYLMAVEGEHGLEKAIDELLAPLPGEMRRYVEILSRAFPEGRSFRDDDVMSVLKEQENHGLVNYARAVGIRRALSRANFIYWDDEKRGYILDPGIHALFTAKKKLEKSKQNNLG